LDQKSTCVNKSARRAATWTTHLLKAREAGVVLADRQSGYPATLFVLGLLLTNTNRDVKSVAATMFLSVGAATLH
jgi:hypothetical protein